MSRSLSRLGPLIVGVVMTAAGAMHFVVPMSYEKIVPHWIGHDRQLVYVSGAVEALSGILILVPRSRRLGGLMLFVTLLAVYPANIQSAIDGYIEGIDLPGNDRLVLWARVPVQIPMLWVAYRLAWPKARRKEAVGSGRAG